MSREGSLWRGAAAAGAAMTLPMANAAAADLSGAAPAWANVSVTAAGLLAGASLVALLASAALRRVLVPPPIETRVADVLQFESVVDDGVTIRTKDGQLVRTLVLSGMDLGAKTADEASALLRKRQAWFQAMGTAGRSIKILSVRERVEFDTAAFFDVPMLQQIHTRWMRNFEEVYQNRHYLVISVREERKALSRLTEIVRETVEALHEYGPQLLEVGQGPHSPLLSFWGSMVNGFSRPIPANYHFLSERLAVSELHFDPVSGVIEYRDGLRVRFGQVVTVSLWGEADGPELMQRLLALPGRLQVLQLVYGVRKERAAAMLPLWAKQAALVVFNRFKAAQYEAALDLVNGDMDSLLDVQVSVLVHGDSLEELETLAGAVRRVISDHGAGSVIECASAEWTWRGRLPGFGESKSYALRPRSLMGENLASLVSFEEEARGAERSDWGDGPVRVFKTVTGGAYAFQFHVSDAGEAIGHTVTFAPSGSGKTVLFSHLMGGALRHPDLACYAFDRNHGLQVFTEAVGGRYVNPTVDPDVELNPLQMPDSLENRRFLQLWLLRLAGIGDDDSGSYEAAARAVDAIYNVRQASNRSLRSVFEGAFDTGSPLRDGLKRWVSADYFGARVFNGAYDSLNLEESRLVTFEMASALGVGDGGDSRLAAALVSYIMHRIRSRCRAEGSPHMVFIDETAALLADEAFRRDTEVMLREHRKLRGSVNLVFQDVGVMLRSGIGETVLNNCPTHLIFPNANAREEDYRVLGLTESQWAYVKGQSRIARHLPHSVLVKRGQEAVILDTDLSPLGSLLRVYRSGAESVRLMNDLKRQVGDRWVETYLDAAA